MVAKGATRKNRKRRSSRRSGKSSGGEFLGQGAHKATYNVGCALSGETLCTKMGLSINAKPNLGTQKKIDDLTLNAEGAALMVKPQINAIIKNSQINKSTKNAMIEEIAKRTRENDLKIKLEIDKLTKQSRISKLTKQIKNITLHCDNDSNNVLYVGNNQKILVEQDDIKQFITFIYDTQEEIASIFRADTDPTYKEYMDELNVNREINKIYGSESSIYVTSAPYKYIEWNILGMVVNFSDNQLPLYVIFGSKCKQIKGPADLNLSKFTTDILNSLIVLQKNQYEHNDIKIDNIVLCDTDYKLIDWGKGHKISKTLNPPLPIGARLSTNPIRWYLNGYIGLGIPTALSLFAATSSRYKDFAAWIPYQNTLKRIYKEFNVQINQYSPPELYDKFKNSFDIYMLGITILHAVFLKGDNREHLYHFMYRKIIDAFTSLDNPLNAEEALTKYIEIQKSVHK